MLSCGEQVDMELAKYGQQRAREREVNHAVEDTGNESDEEAHDLIWVESGVRPRPVVRQ